MHSVIHPTLRLLRKYFNLTRIIPEVLVSPKELSSIMVDISHLHESRKLLLGYQFAQILDEGKLTLVEKNDLDEFKFIQHNCVTSVFLKVLMNNSLW